MTDNYKYVKQAIESINNAIRELYKQMNDYLEYILNLPSTINRIITYHCIGLPSDPNENKRWIMFNGKIIKEYVLEPSIDIMLQEKWRGLL